MLIKEGRFWLKYIPDYGESVTVNFDSKEALNVGKAVGIQRMVKLRYLCGDKTFTVRDLMVFAGPYQKRGSND